MVLPIVAEVLRSTYGCRGTILLLGGFVLHTSPLLLLMQWSSDEADAEDQEILIKRQLGKEGINGNSSDLQTVIQRSAEGRKFEGSMADADDSLEGHTFLEISSNGTQHPECEHCRPEHLDSLAVAGLDVENGTSICGSSTVPDDISSKLNTCDKGCVLQILKSLGLLSLLDRVKVAMHYVWRSLNVSFIIQNATMMVIFVVRFLHGVIRTAWIAFLIPKGFPLTWAVFTASFGGLGNMFGSLAQGPILHMQWFAPSGLCVILSLINAVVLLMDPLIDTFWVWGLSSFFSGLTLSSTISISIVLLKENFPEEGFGTAFGFSALFGGVGQPIGGLLVGRSSTYGQLLNTNWHFTTFLSDSWQ